MTNKKQYNVEVKPGVDNSTGFTFVRDGISEAVVLEKWGWAVVYKDGTELHQFDDNMCFHQFSEIYQPNVKMFVMYNTANMTQRYDLVLEGNVQLFHFYRYFVLENDTRREKVYGFGWKDRETGVTSYNYIMPDGRLLTANHDIIDLVNYNL